MKKTTCLRWECALACVAISCVTAWVGAHAGSRVYPAAPPGDVVDDYHGTQVPDPYRWLEDVASAQTRTWLEAESKLAASFFKGGPGRDTIRERLVELMDERTINVPWREADRVFWTETVANQSQAVLRVSTDDGKTSRVIFDPNEISPDGSTAFEDFAVSPDGRWLMYRTSEGGSDAGAIRVRSLDTGEERGDAVNGYNGCWTRDSGGFFYARGFADPEDAGSRRRGLRAYYHRLGADPARDREIIAWGEEARWVYFMVSEDGRYSAAVAEEGTVSEIFIMELGDSDRPDVAAAPFEIMDGTDAFHTPIEWVGSTFYLRTQKDAPRQRIVAIDLRNRADAAPRPVVPESSDVIVDAVITGERLVVHYLSDVHSRVSLFSLDGTPDGEIELPGIGSAGWPLSGRPSNPELFFSFESFLDPPTIYRYDVHKRTARVFQDMQSTHDHANYETKQLFYPSKDGTRVPMFVTAEKGIKLDGTHPVFLTAYGGYGAILRPAYSLDIPLWLERGGVYVQVSIRGGGEYGDAWHRAGMLEHKQTSFDDFIAAAEYLIESGYTTRGRIAVYGHSNGGLLIGAVLTQRPDLFGAAVANAGHYDMLRYQRFTSGAAWVTEYGSSDDARAFAYLRAYSPLQNVNPGACYPPTLLLAADHDDRVVPSHSYKFAAALQAAQACDAPVLLRVAVNASHGYVSSREMIEERADMWTFIARALDVSP